MSDTADEAVQRARFTAREFVARLARELGVELDPFLAERIAFGYEMGYLRGWCDGARSATMFSEQGAREEEVTR